jgi:hypothetical protein
MLTKLEILHWDDVEPFLAQFDALDTDKSGRLDRHDLAKMVEDKKARLEAKKAKLEQLKRAKAGGSGSGSFKAASVAPAPYAPTSTDGVFNFGADEVDDDLDELEKDLAKLAPATAPSKPAEYGGIGARNRELQGGSITGRRSTAGSGGAQARRKRGIPIIGGGLPMQVLAGVRRPRRPNHLRSQAARTIS